MSIIEVEVAIIIIGLVMTALSSAMMVVIQSSTSEQKRTQLETELRHYAELVREAPYVPCADPLQNHTYMPGDPTLQNYTVPTGMSLNSVTAMMWENPGPQGRYGIPAVDLSTASTQLVSPTQYQNDKGTCPQSDGGMQYISITFKDNTTGVQLSTNVLKRQDGS